jgi:membrane protease YdiL (CAAX protease family)
VIQSVPACPDVAAARGTATTTRNRLYALHIAVAFVLLEGALWSAGIAQRVWFWSAVIWVVLTVATPSHSRRELGLGLEGLRGTWWLLPLSLAAAATAVATAWWVGYLHPGFGEATQSSQYFAYGLWAVFQQLILQSYFFLRLERMLGSGRQAVVACALLFAFMHLPNFFLTVATFIAGLALCELFRRHRNVYPLGLAHAIWALCLAVTLSADVHHDLRVGFSYLYPPPTPSALYSWDKSFTAP